MATESDQLKAIHAEARRVAASYKRRAVALVASVVDREGTQEKAGKVLGISKQRVGKILKHPLTEEVHALARTDSAGAEARTVRVLRFHGGAIEVHVSGTTDGVETGPERIEFASTPTRHEDADEVEQRLADYLAGLRADGYRTTD